jgi:LPS O-antigen subunit length determinant protein (WzzB/FepE family)
MVENISAKDMITKIIKWRKSFMWITILSTIVAIVLLWLMPKQYQSTAILFPARQFSVSKLVVEANAGNQEDYMIMGDEDDCEKLIQILTSDALKVEVADAFDLWHRWDIKDNEYRFHYLRLKWEDMVSVKRTEYNSVKVVVYDYTANGAAEIANGISDYTDTVRFKMNKPIVDGVVRIVKHEYELTLQRMKELQDSLAKLRGMGIMHYKEMVKAYMKVYAKAVEKGDGAAMKRIEIKLDTLRKYGSAYQYTKDNLDKYASKYPDIKMKYDEALVNADNFLPIKFVVERAIPNEFKAKPKRMIFLFITILAANLIGLFFLLFRERFTRPE